MSETKHDAAPLVGFDEVEQLSAVRIEVRKTLEPSDPVFAGHYPHQPIFPGVLILDAMMQALRYQCRSTRQSEIRLKTLKSLRFSAPLWPGDSFTVQCENPGWGEQGTTIVKALCMRGDEKIATARIEIEEGANHA